MTSAYEVNRVVKCHCHYLITGIVYFISGLFGSNNSQPTQTQTGDCQALGHRVSLAWGRRRITHGRT